MVVKALMAVGVSIGLLLAGDTRADEPAPGDAVAGIVKLFDRYSVVMLGEYHDKRELAKRSARHRCCQSEGDVHGWFNWRCRRQDER